MSLIFTASDMQYCRLNNRLLNKFEEVIDDYLFSKTIFSPSSTLIIEPLNSEMNLSSQLINIKQLVKSSPPKQKKTNQFRNRLNLKTLTYNNVTITKNSIILNISRSKVPDLQISYIQLGKKYRLSFPKASGVMVKVTLSTSELEIDGKNVILQEFVEINGKTKWTVKSIFHNGVTAKVSFNPKKYDKIQLQKYFQHNKISYFITDPEKYVPPNQSVSDGLISLKQEKDEQCFFQIEQPKYDFTFQGFTLPIDPLHDYAIDEILAPLLEKPVEHLCYSEINEINCQQQSHFSKTLSPNEVPIVINTEQFNETKSDNNGDTKSENTINVGPKTQMGCNIQNYKHLTSRGKKIKKQDLHLKSDLHLEQEQANLENYLLSPSTQVLDQTKQLRQSIQNLDKHQKHYILADILKIRKFQNRQFSVNDKLMPCPIYTCKVNLETPRELRWHIYKEHPFLMNYGIRVSQSGKISYTQKALDYALYLGMIYPSQVKKIIKKMKMNK